MTRTTREPVTTSGWYEHTDGTVGRYSWHNGRLRLNETVESWEYVRSDSERYAQEARDEAAADAEVR